MVFAQKLFLKRQGNWNVDLMPRNVYVYGVNNIIYITTIAPAQTAVSGNIFRLKVILASLPVIQCRILYVHLCAQHYRQAERE